jgi:hypothetical protein
LWWEVGKLLDEGGDGCFASSSGESRFSGMESPVTAYIKANYRTEGRK